MAFKLIGQTPAPGDFVAASWETINTQFGTTYNARCLVGPGGMIQLQPGVYGVWIKIVDNPEIPVAQVDQLTIT